MSNYVDLYYTINPEGTLSGQSLYNSLAPTSGEAVGGINTTTQAAHYSSPQYGTGSSDFVFNFQNFASPATGMITLHNVDPSTSLTSLGNHFQFGSTQNGTAGVDTFTFNTPAGASSDFSSFQQFDHITNFDITQDNINIALPVGLFNSISSNGTLDSLGIEAAIKASSATTQGGIDIIKTANGSTSLVFVTSSTTDTYPHGAITLDGVTLAPGSDIDAFGSHLRFGSIQQGTSGADNFIYDHAVNGNASNLSGFKEYDHLIDFDTGLDSLSIKISGALYNTINDLLYPGPGQGLGLAQATSADLAQALDTGVANGQPINTQITVAHVSAQYGTGVDSILQFTTNSVMSGSITLHNVSINHITEIPNLVVTH